MKSWSCPNRATIEAKADCEMTAAFGKPVDPLVKTIVQETFLSIYGIGIISSPNLRKSSKE